ncbi:hypothetical protein NOV72_02747 [Caballeronia novacaledonica]|uniref:DUF86 domain-containing protein n=1 Tax=Caballeronia novacaledonica TaxID=1544861 RepID=A0A2U3I5Z8_9BURK|nr:HepT-like ribonuclease domain-containing protein [Caballeronia novacaledonica]SPB15527.1 hypothetical protein NOV72_02747 [Caballeronia novacaledonica]
MSRDALTLREYVDHVITAIGRIARYTDGLDEAAFGDDELVQDAVIRNIEVIGEACRNIRRYFPAFVARHPEVPFQSRVRDAQRAFAWLP